MLDLILDRGQNPCMEWSNYVESFPVINQVTEDEIAYLISWGLPAGNNSLSLHSLMNSSSKS